MKGYTDSLFCPLFSQSSAPPVSCLSWSWNSPLLLFQLILSWGSRLMSKAFFLDADSILEKPSYLPASSCQTVFMSLLLSSLSCLTENHNLKHFEFCMCFLTWFSYIINYSNIYPERSQSMGFRCTVGIRLLLILACLSWLSSDCPLHTAFPRGLWSLWFLPLKVVLSIIHVFTRPPEFSSFFPSV